MTMTNEPLDEDCFEKLPKLRAKVNNWQCEKERRDFLRQLYPLISNWEGPYPNLRAIFARGEIDAFLGESVLASTDYHREVAPLLDFVIRSGYKDDDDDDKEQQRSYGSKKSSVYRVTPVHRARAKYYGTHNGQALVHNLFRVYNCYEVNYRDAEGYTHLHVACEFGCEEIVELFLKLGRVSPDCQLRGGGSGDSPLHLATKRGRHAVARLLQRHGADVNLANAEGHTALHIICKNYSDAKYAERFFEIERELLAKSNSNNNNPPAQPRLRIDARDNEGRTPLQWAVASLLPDMVDVLIDNGADLASFVFPTESYLGERFKSRNKISYCFRLRLASDALACIERLERRGYELKRDDARTIQKFFANHGLFEKTTTQQQQQEESQSNWRDQEEFAEKSKEIMVTPSLSLYDLVRLRPEAAAKRVAYGDYFKFARRTDLWDLPEAPRDACLVHLCETMSRRFFRSWAIDPFIELTRNRLPLLCCDLIVDNLKNEDLWRVCLAAAIEIT